jgi:hypothetical protein
LIIQSLITDRDDLRRKHWQELIRRHLIYHVFCKYKLVNLISGSLIRLII